MRERKKTKYTGVYEQISPEKKYKGKPDSCYYITYKTEGRLVWEKIGWRSDGVDAFTAKTVRDEKLIKAKLGSDPRLKVLSLEDAWNEYYSRHMASKSSAVTVEILWRTYLQSSLGTFQLAKITPTMISDLSQGMTQKGKAPQTVKYTLALLKSIYKYVIKNELYSGTTPNITMPKIDNQRLRFLTPAEAEKLLLEMDKRSDQWGDICRVSLFAGLRLGEILSLEVGHIKLDAGIMHIMDAKAGTRVAYIGPDLLPVIKKRIANKQPNMLLFIQKNGTKIKYVSQSFPNAIRELEFNKGVEDSRHKVVFHTLRHTFASWLAMEGTPLYVIAELMGHKTLEMTNRYKHLCPDQKQSAVALLGNVFRAKQSQ